MTYWSQRFDIADGVIPDIPMHFSNLYLCDPRWSGPITVEPHQRRWRLRYSLPGQRGERSEMFSDKTFASAREAEVTLTIRAGRFVDPAYRLTDALEFCLMLVDTAPSPDAHRPLNEAGRCVRREWLARTLMPLIDGLSVEQMIRSAAQLDAALDDTEKADTTRGNSRHNLRWLLRRLVDLGLCPRRVVTSLPKIPVRCGRDLVPTEADYDGVIAVLSPEQRLAVRVIEETLCRPGELSALEVRDWRPDLGVLAVRVQGTERRDTKTRSTATYALSPGLASELNFAIGKRSAGPLLVDGDGRRITDNVLGEALRAACEAAGSLSITTRNLRMIGGSRLLAAGAPPELISRRLRHSTQMTTTERYYLRFVPGMDRMVVDALDEYLGGVDDCRNADDTDLAA